MTGDSIAAPATAVAQASGPGGKRHLSDRSRAERKLAFYLVAPAAIVMIAVTAYPIIDTIILSLQRASLDRPGQNKFIGLDNYGYVFKAHLFWMDLIHTAVITVVSVSIELVLGMLLALAMHRVIFWRGALRSIALVPYAIVAVVAAYAWQYSWSLDDGGWIPRLLGLSGDPLSHQFGSYVAIIMTEVWKNTPYMALLLLAGLSLVPDELLEAAKIDGATAWQRFTRITLPLMKPAILVALLFRTLDAFRIFDVIYIFSQGANNTASLSQLSYSTLLERLNLGLGSAVSVVLFVLVGIIAFVFIKGFGAAANPASEMEQ
jgi:multiple sugar transport system permease protein